MKTPVSETDFQDLNLVKRGKVRDIYDLGENLLMVATDRISAFDVVMAFSFLIIQCIQFIAARVIQ